MWPGDTLNPVVNQRIISTVNHDFIVANKITAEAILGSDFFGS